jgi:outer membrane protein TolC
MLALLFSALVSAEPLAFEAALALAERVPEVEADVRAGEARDELADEVHRVTYNPLVQVQPGVRRMASGGRAGEVYVNVYQRFSLTGAGRERQAAVRSEQRHDHALIGLGKELARRRIAQAWLMRWAAQSALAEAEAEVRIAEELSARTARTFAAGESTRVDVAAIQSWAAEAALFALTGEGEAFDTGVVLAQALGSPEAGSLAVRAEAPAIDLPSHEWLDRLIAAAPRAPEVVAANAGAGSEAARLREVHATKGANFALGGMGWREGSGDVAGVGTLELEIPVFERGQRERAAQAANSARAAGHARVVEVAEAARRIRLVHELEHSQAVVDVLDARLVRAAEDLAIGQEKRFMAREATALEWVLARQKLLRARIDLVRARAAHLYARFLVSEAAKELTP